MSGAFSREALAAVLGDNGLALAEADALRELPELSPMRLKRLQRILGPAAAELARAYEPEPVPVVADAVSADSQMGHAA